MSIPWYLDLNNNGVNDWSGAGSELKNLLFQPFYSVNKLDSFMGGSGNIFQDLGSGVGNVAGDVGGGLFKGLTSNIGGVAVLGIIALIAMEKIQ